MEQRKNQKQQQASRSIMSFFKVDTTSSRRRGYTAPCKRKLQPEAGLYLGRLPGKALATLTMSVTEGQCLQPRFPRVSASSHKADCTLRLATSADCISNSKLVQPNCEVLQPLLREEIVQAEFRSASSYSRLDGLQTFDIEVDIHLSSMSLDTQVERPADVRQRISQLFELLNLQPARAPTDIQSEQLPEQDPPTTFTSTLFPFQKQALHWMLQREHCTTLHHMWDQFNTPGGPLFYNPYTGVLSRTLPTEDPRCRGGILADEMGFGKTAVVIALIHCSKWPRSRQPKRLKLDTGGTLVVVNPACLQQWVEEFAAHGEGLSVQEFTGEERVPLSELKRCDVVLTTYGIAETSQLCQVPWFRIVFDDAHCLATKTLKNCYKLQSQLKWLVTGQPVHTDSDCAASLVKMLSFLPQIGSCWGSNVQRLLESVMLRRTKDSKSVAGLPLIRMPPLVFRTVFVEFSPEEREVYKRLQMQTRTLLDSLACERKVSNLTAIIELVLKLRQFCDHPCLVTQEVFKPMEQIEKFIGNLTINCTGYTADLIAKIREGQEFECPVCLDPVYDPVITKCCHVFCRLCALQQIDLNKNCPLCKLGLRTSDLRSLPQCFSMKQTMPKNTSAKVRSLLKLLRTEPQRTVVFSQWRTMVSILEQSLADAGLPYQRVDSYKQPVDWSQQTVLIPFKPGTLGTSLTSASRVILFDPWWNASVEHQAIQKVHCLGQESPVTVVRLVTRDTIEEKLLELRPIQASLNLDSLKFVLSK